MSFGSGLAPDNEEDDRLGSNDYIDGSGTIELGAMVWDCRHRDPPLCYVSYK